MRLLDAMILIYFAKVGLLEALLQLPDLAITSSVRREVRSSPAKEIMEAGLASGALSLCDIDPMNAIEQTLYRMYRDGDGFHGLGEGEATCLSLAHARGFTFVSHDRKARGRAGSAGMRPLDSRDLLTELNDTGIISPQQRKDGERAILLLLKE